MASFADLEAAEPEFAVRVRAAFDAHGHKVLATLRPDGSPRVSGIEARFADGHLWLAGMPRSVTFVDLRRDPRMALHSGSDEPADSTADAKVPAGRPRSPTRGCAPASPPPRGCRPTSPSSCSTWDSTRSCSPPSPTTAAPW
jgi:hypothetical protein